MASVEDIVEATEIIDEDSENPVDGSGSKPEENRVRVLDIHKDDDGYAAADATVVTEGVVGAETVIESIFEGNCCLGVMDNQKLGVGSLSSAGDGGVDCVVGRDEKINHGDFFYLNNVGSESKRLKEIGRTSSDVEAGGNGKGRWNGEKLEDGDHGFCVGDFVWGKIKSHPWWPGQVYDPRDASEFAVKHSQEGRLLVAFFGDGSCSWCLPSQLVPFIENFKQLSMDGSSKSFLNSIQRAVDEIGRVVESKMTCKCVPLEKRDHLARPMVANAGVKSGILVPEVDINRLPSPEYEPAEILAEVVNFAKVVSVDNVFELGILRSWLSAFYYAKCGYPLAVYREPLHIEGLEDKDDNETAFASDFSVPIEVPIQGPQEDEWVSSPAVNSAKSPASSDDKIYHRRKQKSVAELMGKNNNDKPKSQKSLKRQKSTDGEVEEGGSQRGSSTRKTGRKRSIEVSESDNITEEKPKKIEVAAFARNSVEAKEELENVSSPRERKKSKYLSPPYTDPSWRKIYSCCKPESESDKASSLSESDDEMSDEKLHSSRQKQDASVQKNARAVENYKKLTFSVSDVDVLVNEVLSEIQFAGLDPFYLRNKGSLDMVWAFISAFRSSTYLHGSDYRVYQQSKRVGRKRKSLPSRMGNREKETDDLITNVRVIRHKLDMMTAILENHCSRFSREDKSSLRDEMKHLMEDVEAASEKVRVVAENSSS